jgi:hypothetical protein
MNMGLLIVPGGKTSESVALRTWKTDAMAEKFNFFGFQTPQAFQKDNVQKSSLIPAHVSAQTTTETDPGDHTRIN